MPKKANPLKGLKESEIRKLIEDADILEDDDESEDEESPFEIILRGKDASKVLESLGIIRDKNYDPDEETEEDQDDKDEKPSKKSVADRLLGL